MEQRLETEIVELHQFFVDWFNGTLDSTDDAFSRVEKALSDDFVLISPRGVSDSRAPLLDMIRRAHDSKSDFEIWIKHPRSRKLADGCWLVTYEEWQRSAGSTTARQSTAIFSADAAAPNGVVWQHVHETWLPES